MSVHCQQTMQIRLRSSLGISNGSYSVIVKTGVDPVFELIPSKTLERKASWLWRSCEQRWRLSITPL